MSQKFYLLPEDLGNKVVGYLGRRPYAEVFELIRGLQGMMPAPEVGTMPTMDSLTQANQGVS